MRNCLNCSTPIEQVPKKREKKFCNSTCRSNYWQKQNGKPAEQVSALLPGLFMIKFQAEGFIKADFDSLLAQMNSLPRSVSNGFYHFEYADQQLITTATPVETITITLTKDNFKPLPEKIQEALAASMPDIPLMTKPAKASVATNPKFILGDPKERSGGFFMKFGAFTYDDPEFKRP